MSADNGIYILKTRDQYRVAHLQAIDNISWSAIDGNWQNRKETRGRYVPTRIVEMWGDCKFTRDKNIADDIAKRWAESLPICEYGVSTITYNKTWKQILKDAREYARDEIEFITENGKEKYWNMDRLHSIARGDYLFAWLNRERYNKDIRQHDCGYWSVCNDRGCKCAIEKHVNGFDNAVYEKMKHDGQEVD